MGPVNQLNDELMTWIGRIRYDNMNLVSVIFSTYFFSYRSIFSDNRHTLFGIIIINLISLIIELSLWISTRPFGCIPTWICIHSRKLISTNKNIKAEAKANLFFLRIALTKCLWFIDNHLPKYNDLHFKIEAF